MSDNLSDLLKIMFSLFTGDLIFLKKCIRSSRKSSARCHASVGNHVMLNKVVKNTRINYLNCYNIMMC